MPYCPLLLLMLVKLAYAPLHACQFGLCSYILVFFNMKGKLVCVPYVTSNFLIGLTKSQPM